MMAFISTSTARMHNGRFQGTDHGDFCRRYHRRRRLKRHLHHPTDANGNVVVDDNHVHNEGEDHLLLIEFDNLFGGDANARYCYYGISEHPGVNVVYNNK